jgi:RNA 2',3'-cyclic 3'-phosphodiesterase
MIKKRIFIAVNLPEYLKEKLLSLQKDWANLPVRWTRKSSLHITLVFIGYLDNQEMLEVCQTVQRIGSAHQPFSIRLSEVCLGPTADNPRMIWAKGQSNPTLAKLKNDLEDSLSGANLHSYRQDNRAFSPHITLARIRPWDWRLLPQKPEIEKEISLNFPVESMEVMESQLKRSGAEYTIFESALLGDKNNG